MPHRQLIHQMIQIGEFCHQRDWVPASAGNFSARLDNNTILVTRSGAHKGYLSADDFLHADLDGQTLDIDKTPSAETLLHCERYRALPEVNAVLHTHSLASTLIPSALGTLRLENYELLKIFGGIKSHQSQVDIPILENDQDMPKLAAQVSAAAPAHAYIIAGHGIYVWGDDLRQCQNRLEAMEFLLNCELQKQGWGKPAN